MLGVLIAAGIGIYMFVEGGKSDEARAVDYNGTWVITGRTTGNGSSLIDAQFGIDDASSVLGIVGNSAQLVEGEGAFDYVFEFDGTDCLFQNADGTYAFRGVLAVGTLTLSDGNGNMRIYTKRSDVYPPETAPQSSQDAQTPFQQATVNPDSQSQVQQPVATEPQQPVPTDPQQPVATDPQQPVVTDPQQPIVTDPQQPVATDPQQPVATDPRQPQAQDPSAAYPQQPADAQQPVVTDPQQQPSEPQQTNIRHVTRES